MMLELFSTASDPFIDSIWCAFVTPHTQTQTQTKLYQPYIRLPEVILLAVSFLEINGLQKHLLSIIYCIACNTKMEINIFTDFNGSFWFLSLSLCFFVSFFSCPRRIVFFDMSSFSIWFRCKVKNA